MTGSLRFRSTVCYRSTSEIVQKIDGYYTPYSIFRHNAPDLPKGG